MLTLVFPSTSQHLPRPSVLGRHVRALGKIAAAGKRNPMLLVLQKKLLELRTGLSFRAFSAHLSLRETLADWRAKIIKHATPPVLPFINIPCSLKTGEYLC